MNIGMYSCNGWTCRWTSIVTSWAPRSRSGTSSSARPRRPATRSGTCDRCSTRVWAQSVATRRRTASTRRCASWTRPALVPLPLALHCRSPPVWPGSGCPQTRVAPLQPSDCPDAAAVRPRSPSGDRCCARAVHRWGACRRASPPRRSPSLPHTGSDAPASHLFHSHYSNDYSHFLPNIFRCHSLFNTFWPFQVH